MLVIKGEDLLSLFPSFLIALGPLKMDREQA